MKSGRGEKTVGRKHSRFSFSTLHPFTAIPNWPALSNCSANSGRNMQKNDWCAKTAVRRQYVGGGKDEPCEGVSPDSRFENHVRQRLLQEPRFRGRDCTPLTFLPFMPQNYMHVFSGNTRREGTSTTWCGTLERRLSRITNSWTMQSNRLRVKTWR